MRRFPKWVKPPTPSPFSLRWTARAMVHRPLKGCKRYHGVGQKQCTFLKNKDFLECRDKKSEFGLGSAFFGISDLGFLHYGVPNKGVIEKGWIFDKKLGTLYFFGDGQFCYEICACHNLEYLSVPEGLVHSIRILVAPGVFLARRWRRC